MIYLIAAAVSVVKEFGYTAWCNAMKRILGHIWDIFEETTEPPAPESDEYFFNQFKNAFALYMMRETCGSDRFCLIENIPTAKIAWDTLSENYNANTGTYFSSPWKMHLQNSKLSL